MRVVAKKMRGRKRDLFAELSEGMIALLEERQYKRAVLRSHAAERQKRREPERSKIRCLENVGKT